MLAPKIDNIIARYRQSHELWDPLISPKLNTLYEMLIFIKPEPETHLRQIWIEVLRGDLNNFGDFNDFLEDGEVETFEEFEILWNEFYPDEKKWYNLSILKEREDIYFSVNIKTLIMNKLGS